MYYARSANDLGEMEPLIDHLSKTAKLCSTFAEHFGFGEAGETLGYYHDLGKASQRFQDVLSGKQHNVNHCAAGAFVLEQKIKKPSFMRTMLADVMYAHHSELCYCTSKEYLTSVREQYDSKHRTFSTYGLQEYGEVAQFLKSEKLPSPAKKSPLPLSDKNHVEKMLLYRMLYSALVDADWSASASHNNANYLQEVSGKPLDYDTLLKSLSDYREKICKSSTAKSSINDVRNELYDKCTAAAVHPSGLFTLTAPTGSGKTLAMLNFALNHGKEKSKRRIIFVLPFLSLIEQNAEIYRRICGDVAEIHSQTDYDSNCNADEREKYREMTERFDAPVIVTTSVRFFEMLFRHENRDCRGLHNLSDSVILFDEAQTLPIHLTKTSLKAVQALCTMFRSTVVFSTATQPCFSAIEGLQWQPYEIADNGAQLYEKTKRTTLNMEIDFPLSFEEIAGRMSKLENVCCIVNRKSHAQQLFDLIKSENPEGCYHISTNMCAYHRTDTIAEIRQCLAEGKPCRVVSTSCIEAGVDLDFAQMFRALAPLESIIQSAGRCNRNGKGNGLVTVFEPDVEKKRLYPTEWYGTAASMVKLLWERHSIDIDNPQHIKEYYELLFLQANQMNMEKHLLEEAIENYDFREVSRLYKFIEQNTVNVVVPYFGKDSDGNREEQYKQLLSEAKSGIITNEWVRRATKFSVSSYQRDKVHELCEQLYFRVKKEKIPSTWYILRDSDKYDCKTGLNIDKDSFQDMIF